MDFTEIMQLKILDCYSFTRNNREIRDQFPTLPIFTASAEIPPVKEIKLKQNRIKSIIDKFVNRGSNINNN